MLTVLLASGSLALLAAGLHRLHRLNASERRLARLVERDFRYWRGCVAGRF